MRFQAVTAALFLAVIVSGCLWMAGNALAAQDAAQSSGDSTAVIEPSETSLPLAQPDPTEPPYVPEPTEPPPAESLPGTEIQTPPAMATEEPAAIEIDVAPPMATPTLEPSAMPTVTGTPAPATLSIEVLSATLPAIDYSLEPQQVIGSITILIDARYSQENGWHILVEGIDLPTDSGTVISAGDISLQTVGAPSRIDGEGMPAPAYVDLPASLEQPVVLVSAPGGAAMGRYRLSFEIAIHVPAGTPSGSYNGGLTLTSVIAR